MAIKAGDKVKHNMNSPFSRSKSVSEVLEVVILPKGSTKGLSMGLSNLCKKKDQKVFRIAVEKGECQYAKEMEKMITVSELKVGDKLKDNNKIITKILNKEYKRYCLIWFEEIVIENGAELKRKSAACLPHNLPRTILI